MNDEMSMRTGERYLDKSPRSMSSTEGSKSGILLNRKPLKGSFGKAIDVAPASKSLRKNINMDYATGAMHHRQNDSSMMKSHFSVGIQKCPATPSYPMSNNLM
jgi:hypothetical protein